MADNNENNDAKDTAGHEDSALDATGPEKLKRPSLLRNYTSLIGGVIASAALTSILLLFLLEFSSGADNPYLGILTYVLLPSVLVFGLLLILAGVLWERRRRRKSGADYLAAYPKLDLNDPAKRRAFATAITLAFMFIFLSAFGSYRAYEFTESVVFCGQTCHTVMKPEFTAFQVAAHAKLRCVDCHVGAGPEWYVRSKFTGVYQLYSVAFNKFSRPISSPVHNMRRAAETCAQCHWPQKYYGEQLKVFEHFSYDETNARQQVRMLVKVGGGSPETGPVSGIHWHMSLSTEVSFIATDEQRQNITYVRMKDAAGKVTEFFAAGAKLSPAEVEKAPKRLMDCIDCHNRPTHVFLPPDNAVDLALAAGRLDATLPFIKRKAVELLSMPYATSAEAERSINDGLENYYRESYKGVYQTHAAEIRAATGELTRIYQTYFFPEMKTDWRSHPNNIGHYYYQGCFRCHDGNHISSAGVAIRSDCTVCHTLLDQTSAAAPATSPPAAQVAPGVPAMTGVAGIQAASAETAFKHPVALGDLAKLDCTACHRTQGPFKHPVDLGDISRFACVDCHSGKVWPTSHR